MPTTASDGLARLQGESRISANTWREWSSRLGLDPSDVVELWDEVCHPLMVASGAAPDIAFVMQLRAIRSDLYIEEFRDEVPAVLLAANLLDSLHDDRLSGAKSKSAILKLSQHMTTADPGGSPEQFRRALVVDLCTAILLAKVMPGDNVSLSRLVRLLLEGRATLEKLAALALKSTSQEPFADLICRCLQAREAAVAAPSPTPSAPAPGSAGEDEDEDEDEPADGQAPGGEDGGVDDGDDEEVDDAAEDGPQGNETDLFLSAFSAAMEAVYQSEASELGLTQDTNERLSGRLRALGQFHPLRSRIPSMEEAQKLGRQRGGNDSGRQRALDRAQSSTRKSPPRPVMTARPSRPGTGGPGGGSVGVALPSPPGQADGRPSVIKGPASAGASAAGRGATPGVSAPGAAGIPTSTTGVAVDASAVDTSAVDTSAVDASAVDGGAGNETDDRSGNLDVAAGAASVGQRIAVLDIARHEMSEVVSRIAQLLGFLEELDERVWKLLCEPAMELADPRRLAEDLLADDSGAQQAYGAVRIVADKQAIKRLLSLPPDRRLNERRFDLELACFINTINNSRRGFEPDSRQLISLPKTLDYAAACLVRLEALRTALALARESGADFDAAAATARFDEALCDVTYMADQKLVESARARADIDVATVGEAVVADLTVDRLIEGSCAYARQLEVDGHTSAVEAVDEAVAATPLRFEGVEPGEELPGQLPDRHTAPTKLGEIHDRVRGYVFERVWPLLQPRHRPQETAARLEAALSEALKGTIRMEPRRERHHKNPKVALAVVSLEALNGNPELGHLYVRVTVDGKLLYIEDFEDGTYIDLFERRKNAKRQMHARARDRAQDDNSGELQMGSNYLYSIGRTNTPFARTQESILKGCVLNETGEPVVYPIF